MMKWQASRQDSSQPVTGKQNHPLPAAGTSGPSRYLNRPQGGVSAEALPEREGAAGSSREAPGITK